MGARGGTKKSKRKYRKIVRRAEGKVNYSTHLENIYLAFELCKYDIHGNCWKDVREFCEYKHYHYVVDFRDPRVRVWSLNGPVKRSK